MSTYVLIIVLSGSGKAATDVPFSSEGQCQYAARTLNKDRVYPIAFCFKR